MKEEERVLNILSDLHTNNQISNELFEDISPIGSQPPRLYGLAKVHKNNTPLRPVLSMPGSPYFKLSEKITQWLSVIPESKINTSTKQVADSIKTIDLDQDEVVISLDVVSLYTNIAVKEAIVEAANKLYSGDVDPPPVDRETFIQLTELATLNVIMSTVDGYYRQVDGLAMGSQPAPLLANICLSTFEPVIHGDAVISLLYG